MESTVRVISLDRSKDRKDEFVRANSGLSYAFVRAVDGRQLPTSKRVDPQLFDRRLTLPSAGAYGCALSHLEQWDFAIAHRVAVTIAEDDAIFRHDFVSESAAVMSRLPPQWDIILWGWNFNSILSVQALPGVSPVVMVFSEELMRRSVDAFRSMTAQSHPLRLDRAFGIPAYSISPAGAAKFKASCFPMRNFALYFPLLHGLMSNTGIDVAMNRVYPQAQAYVAFPPLVITRNDKKISTVQNGGGHG